MTTVGQRDLAASEATVEWLRHARIPLVPNDFLYCAQQISCRLAEFVSVWQNHGITLKGDGSIGRLKSNELAWMK